MSESGVSPEIPSAEQVALALSEAYSRADGPRKIHLRCAVLEVASKIEQFAERHLSNASRRTDDPIVIACIHVQDELCHAVGMAAVAAQPAGTPEEELAVYRDTLVKLRKKAVAIIVRRLPELAESS